MSGSHSTTWRRRQSGKIVLAIGTVVIAFCSSSCSSTRTPQSTVESYLRAVYKGDADKALECVSGEIWEKVGLTAFKDDIVTRARQLQEKGEAPLKSISIGAVTVEGDYTKVETDWLDQKDQRFKDFFRLKKVSGGWRIFR